MRCIQPYISHVEKFGQQIQRSHSLGGNNSFGREIASKYSGFRLGKFSSIAFNWLEQANLETTISNRIQILKNQVVNVLPSTKQLKINLNLFSNSPANLTAITNIQIANKYETSNFLILPQLKPVFVRESTMRLPKNFISPKSNSESIQFDFLASSDSDNRSIDTVKDSRQTEVDRNSNKNEISNDFPTVIKNRISRLINEVNKNWNISTFKRKFSLQKNSKLTLKSIGSNQKVDFKFSHDLKLESTGKHNKKLEHTTATNDVFTSRQKINYVIAQNNRKVARHNNYFTTQNTRELIQSTTIPNQIDSRESKKTWEQSKPINFDASAIDINGITDKVFQAIERKLKTERQRRGIL